MTISGFLDALSAAVGEELAALSGRIATRLTAVADPELQLSRGSLSLDSLDGLSCSLSAGTFADSVAPDTVLRALSSPIPGNEAVVASVTDPTDLTLTPPGLNAILLSSLSWEVVHPADTVIQVESTYLWPSAGEFYLGSVRYRFTGKTATTLTGLTHFDGADWVGGVARHQEVGDTVTDYTRDRTALDKLRRSFYVDTAETYDQLADLGSNNGRPPREGLEGLERYRRYLRAAMFGPFGTMLGLWQVLDAVVGVGNWETFLDFTSPTDDFARVFVRRTDEDPTDPAGKAFLDGEVLVPATAANQAVLGETPLVVGQVCLADDVSHRVVAEGLATTADGAALVSSAAFPSRIQVGDYLEVLDGHLVGQRGRVASWTDTSHLTLGPVRGFADSTLTGAAPAFHWRILRETTDLHFYKPSGDTALEYPADTGTQAWTWQGTLAEASGSVLTGGSDPVNGECCRIGSTTVGQTGWYRRLARIVPESRAVLEFLGTPTSLGVGTDGLQACVEMHDGEKALAFAFFTVGGDDAVAFINASSGAPIGTVLNVPYTRFRTYALEKRGRGKVRLLLDGVEVLTRDYSTFTNSSNHELRLGCLSTATASFLNTRHIAWSIQTDTDYWAARAAAALTLGSPSHVVGALGGIAQAGDVGKVLVLSGGQARNAAGGTVEGCWVIDAYVDANTVTVTGPTLSGAVFRRGQPTRVFLPTDLALQFPDALGHSIQILTGPHAGVYVITKLLSDDLHDMAQGLSAPLDSLLLNGVVDTSSGALATDPAVRGRAAVAEVSGGPPGGFTAVDTAFDWRVVPAFPADSTLLAQISDAGTFAGPTLTLRQNLPLVPGGGFTPVLSIAYSSVQSAHAEADGDQNNVATPRWPFYIWSAWGSLRDVITDQGAEGVVVDLDSLSRDAAGLHISED